MHDRRRHACAASGRTSRSRPARRLRSRTCRRSARSAGSSRTPMRSGTCRSRSCRSTPTSTRLSRSRSACCSSASRSTRAWRRRPRWSSRAWRSCGGRILRRDTHVRLEGPGRGAAPDRQTRRILNLGLRTATIPLECACHESPSSTNRRRAGRSISAPARNAGRTARAPTSSPSSCRIRSGQIAAKVFGDVDAVAREFEAGEFVKVEGRATRPHQKLELLIEKIRRVDEAADRLDGFREEDCIPCAPRPIEDMWQELQAACRACAQSVDPAAADRDSGPLRRAAADLAGGADRAPRLPRRPARARSEACGNRGGCWRQRTARTRTCSWRAPCCTTSGR